VAILVLAAGKILAPLPAVILALFIMLVIRTMIANLRYA
jgi:hypothetical protein